MNKGSIANISQKSFLRPEELASILSISRPTVYRLIEKRQIPFYKIGGSLRFKIEDVMAYLDHNRVEPFNIQPYERNKER